MKSVKENSNIQLGNVIGIEEYLSSFKFGIKCKMDALMLNSLTQELIPFELKTGRKSGSTSHTAQTILYKFLLRERYYLATGDMIRINASINDLASLMISRNYAVSISECYFKNGSNKEFLPPKCESAYT